MTELHTRIAALSPEQRELLERRLADRVVHDPPGGERITARDRSRPAPLSIQQQREWAFGRFRGANNIIGAFRVEGDFDRDILGRALTEVTERHEVLRSTVEEQPDGGLVQVVHPVSAVPVPVDDLTHLGEDEQRSELRRRWEAEVVTPFDADQHHRLRISLLRFGPAEHAVLITTDHSAGDLVSMGFLVEEFAALYKQHSTGCGGLPPVEVQYADFAVWQRGVEVERIDAESEHWRNTLEGVPAGLALPSDRPYPATPTFVGGDLMRELPSAVAVALRRFADDERASLAVVLCAASAVLLHRYTGRQDLVIGEILVGRNRAEIERTLGCFVGALPLRVRVSGEQTLREVVRTARATVVTAYGHQDLPVDAMLDQLDLGPETAVSSLMDMWLDVRTTPTRLEVPGLRILPEPMPSNLAPSPLTLGVNPEADELCLQWLYMTEMFDDETVVLLAGQFERILHEIATSPETTVDGVDLETDPRTVLPAACVGTATPPPTYVELFAARVAQAPHAPAVVCDGVSTSYAELDRDADRLARRLRREGVAEGSLVGILLDRSPRLLTAVLGVLKSGGAYVPLDVDYPPLRSCRVLADAGVEVLLTDGTHESVVAGAAPEGSAPRTVLVDVPAEPEPGDDAPLSLPAPDSLAYVVYTSGSTGTPKGAMVEHGSLMTFAREVQERLGLGSGDRFLQFASPGFDVLAEELFPVWLAGGCVVVPARSVTNGEDDLADLARRERITVMELPTAFWHEWVRELDRRERDLPDCLRMVVIGGERVLPERVERWRRHGTPLVHCYGLTETTVTSTFFRLDPGDPTPSWPNLPIGTPIPSADLSVLDDRLRPVPVGAVGELHIGGGTLARGYLGRAALTAERFVADPASPRGRLYRTGDLVRRRPDGNLEFHSRVDTQIKVRGYRIEPTEVESALNRQPGVAESVVVAVEPALGDRRLVGYVVAATDGGLDLGEVRRHLQGELPGYMVPAELVALEALPVTSNGKVDRAALPEPTGEPGPSGEQEVEPETPVQELLATAVADVLGRPRVGIHDNFFEIGGDSILAIQVVARAAERGVRLTPFDVFSRPTVASLAAVAAVGPVVDAEQGPVSGPAPLAPSQRWLCTAGAPDVAHWNVSAELEPTGPVDDDDLRATVEQVMLHHDGLRQRLLVAGESTRVRVAAPGDATPVALHDLSDLDEEGQDARLAELVDVAQRGLDPAVGPLTRVLLARRGPRPDRLVIVAHGLVADRTSLGILLDDLAAGLRARRDGTEPTLPAKTTSWQSWARRLARHVGSEDVQGERYHWESVVARASGSLASDGPEPDAPTTVASARTMSTALNRRDTDGVRAVAERLGCRVEEVVLAALGRSLAPCARGDAVRVDLERQDRVAVFPEVDLARTVGRFGHVHPVVLPANPDEPASDAVRAVADHLGAVPGDGVGWQLLRQDSDPVSDPGADLVVRFVTPEPPAERPGLRLLGPADGERSARTPRAYPLEVDLELGDGVITARWTHDPARHRVETVAAAAERLVDELRVMAAPGDDEDGPAPVASDFPLARVDQTQLDELLSRL